MSFSSHPRSSPTDPGWSFRGARVAEFTEDIRLLEDILAIDGIDGSAVLAGRVSAVRAVSGAQIETVIADAQG